MKEPKSEPLLAARLARAYPSLSAYSAATLAEELCRIERAQRRHAERCCSGEDGGYVRHLPTGSATGNGGNITSQWNSYAIVHDSDAERKAGERIERAMGRWTYRLATLADNCNAPFWGFQGDPRGPVLLLQLPGDAEAVAV